MPRLSQAMKDVTSCEKPRLGASDRMTRGSPNGTTRRLEQAALRLVGGRTRGTETS